MSIKSQLNSANGSTSLASQTLAAVTNKRYIAPQAAWSRPSDWLAMPSVEPTENKVVILYGVFDSPTNNVALSVDTIGFTVDWGDGTVESFAGGALAEHNYDYANAALDGTLSTHGYKQALITITPTTGGQNIPVVRFQLRYTGAPATQYSTQFLDIVMSAPQATYLSLGGANTVIHGMLERVRILSNNINDAYAMFKNCYKLLNVELSGVGTAADLSYMFQHCYSLVSAPMFNTAGVTSMTYMFNTCSALQNVPAYNTVNVTNMTNTFAGCSSIMVAPLWNTSNVTNTSNVFLNCYSLIEGPAWNTSKVTDGTSMFNGCIALQRVPQYDFASLLNATTMFSGCSVIESVPVLNVPSLTNASNMFAACTGLESVGLLNTGNVTGFSSTFLNCYSLKQLLVPIDTSKATIASSMFSGCYSLQSTQPNFNLPVCPTLTNMFADCRTLQVAPTLTLGAASTTLASMFSNCMQLTTVPLFTTTVVTTMSSMFSGCRSLTSVPAFNTVNVTTTSGMFINCSALMRGPELNLTNCTNTSSMFSNCFSLQTIPAYNTAKVTNAASMFSGCTSLQNIPALIFPMNLMGSAASMPSPAGLTSCTRQQIGAPGNWTWSYNIASCRLGKTALEEVFSALSKTPQTITITGNPGADTPISRAAATVAGSTTVTQTNTASLAVGMLVTGTGISTARTVAFDITTNTFTFTGHGIPNGKLVSFPSQGTAYNLGIVFYVVNATADTFQIALTPGGDVYDITGSANGNATMLVGSFITAIDPNVSITIDIPAFATGNITAGHRILNSSIATVKGWTVSG